eukprot:UN22193
MKMKTITLIISVTLCLVADGALHNGAKCKRNSQCLSNWCEGGSFWKHGDCRSKRIDGADCYKRDGKSCVSGHCVCGKCGAKQAYGAPCATNANCHSGWCEKSGWKPGCTGTCQAKTFECYKYSQEDLRWIHGGHRSEKVQCESHKGFKFTMGNNGNNGCGHCWCCAPRVHNGEAMCENK